MENTIEELDEAGRELDLVEELLEDATAAEREPLEIRQEDLQNKIDRLRP